MLLLKGTASITPRCLLHLGTWEHRPDVALFHETLEIQLKILKCWHGCRPLVNLPSGPLLAILLFCSVCWGTGPFRLLGGLRGVSERLWLEMGR